MPYRLETGNLGARSCTPWTRSRPPLGIYIDDRRDIPKPSAIKRHGKFVTVPVLTEAKLALYSPMRAQRVGKAELARRLNWHLPQVDRLLDLLHSSRLDQLEAAFHALGKRISIVVEESA